MADRTEDLARESRERQEDVRLFVRMLAGLNQSQTMGELWRHALPLIGRRFDLERVVYICSMASYRQYVWPEEKSDLDSCELPEDWHTLLTGSEARIETARRLSRWNPRKRYRGLSLSVPQIRGCFPAPGS